MRRILFCLFFLTAGFMARSQTNNQVLTVEKIMRDPKWIGSSPSNPDWSTKGSLLFFNWNPDGAPADSLYYIDPPSNIPVKAKPEQIQERNNIRSEVYTKNHYGVVFEMGGDIYLRYTDLKNLGTYRITHTVETESNPQFSFNETRVVYTRNQNLYSWNIQTGETEQLTNFKSPESGGSGFTGTGRGNNTMDSSRASRTITQEAWLKNEQLKQFDVLRDRKKNKDATDAFNKSLPKEKEPKQIQLDDRSLQGLNISPDGRFISYRLFRAATGAKQTIVPSYVTETGYTTDLNSRSKVGSPQGTSEAFLYDRIKDTVWSINTDSIPGIRDLPDYVNDYPKQLEERKKKPANRVVSFSTPIWSPSGSTALFNVRAADNKDRWIMMLDTATGKVSLVDRQRDEAWIGGPGIGFGASTGWIDEQTCWFQSEESGYSHIYTFNTTTKTKKALTSGKWEVQQAQLSFDKKYFYITTNEVHPGEQHFYRLTIADGKREKITTMPGANQVTLSPNEQWMAVLHSSSNKPWELYLQRNPFFEKPYTVKPLLQITFKAQSDEFKQYPWREPEVITFKARDGADVYARVYKPANADPSHPAVLFVHGAGYLQNAHKWWSSYYREYMFNNLLTDKGYVVMDIDYRGSAGYGRDWRTGIYRFMGGKDLTDNVDAVDYLVKNYGVDPKHVGLYGGSYGGFITLMGMFTTPDVFAAGAALRPVTDWANYNHGYTANILNEPQYDSIAYHKSSPYYYAGGLKGQLLICHGMVDVNVHFQDAVKLVQRLIELGKDNFTIAPYPMEDHGFVEPSSWTDEYKRILKLFETNLKK